MRSKAINWIQLMLFLASIALVLWVILALHSWAEPLKDYYSFVGSWESYIFLFVMLILIKFVFEKLLKWEAKAFFRRRK
jgi:DMSO/TMAO reductase YedYZ heme-binding membrane subunit